MIMNVNHLSSIDCLCEERSDVAISCYKSNCTTEIATLPSVARDDAVLRHTLCTEGTSRQADKSGRRLFN